MSELLGVLYTLRSSDPVLRVASLVHIYVITQLVLIMGEYLSKLWTSVKLKGHSSLATSVSSRLNKLSF